MKPMDTKTNIASWAQRFAALCAALALATGFTARPAAEPFAYVTKFCSGDVAVIDTASNTVTSTIPLPPIPGITPGACPVAVAFTTDGSRAYVANNQGDPRPVNGHGGGNVWVIDTATNAVTASIETGAFAGLVQVAVNPDRKHAYAGWRSHQTGSTPM